MGTVADADKMHRGVSTCVLTPRTEFDESFRYYHTTMNQDPRRRPRPQPVSHWLARLGEATPAAVHAARLAEAAAHLRACLPPALVPDAALANIHGSTWVCIAQHGAMAHRLRLVAPRVVACLQARGLDVSDIRVEVRARAPEPAPAPKRAILSDAARESLGDLADRLAETDVGAALRRLLDRQDGRRSQTTRTRRSST